MSDILIKIEAQKREEISAAKKRISLSDVERIAKTASPPRGFLNALMEKRSNKTTGMIAEIKKASPSKGIIRENFDPAALARAYETGGAACLSVLTDEKFFKGHADFLKHARAACNLPVLRKDFLYDTYQVTESRAMNADCILIIMASVDDACAQDLLHAAKDLQMDALIEVHDEIELERALQLDAKMIGINNRNLRDFSVDIATSKRLAKLIPDDRLIVSESGISTPQEAQILNEAGISTFLIGETFMREADVAAALGNFLNNADRSAI